MSIQRVVSFHANNEHKNNYLKKTALAAAIAMSPMAAMPQSQSDKMQEINKEFKMADKDGDMRINTAEYLDYINVQNKTEVKTANDIEKLLKDFKKPMKTMTLHLILMNIQH